MFLWPVYRSEGRSYKHDLPVLLLWKLFLSCAFELLFFLHSGNCGPVYSTGYSRYSLCTELLREKCSIAISSVIKCAIMPLYEAIIEY